jgi:hypothetical protein
MLIEVYAKGIADALETDLQPMVGSKLIASWLTVFCRISAVPLAIDLRKAEPVRSPLLKEAHWLVPPHWMKLLRRHAVNPPLPAV